MPSHSLLFMKHLMLLSLRVHSSSRKFGVSQEPTPLLSHHACIKLSNTDSGWRNGCFYSSQSSIGEFSYFSGSPKMKIKMKMRMKYRFTVPEIHVQILCYFVSLLSFSSALLCLAVDSVDYILCVRMSLL